MSPNLEQVFWGIGDGAHLLRVAARLGLAVLLGGVLGIQRGLMRKEAGMRTHILVGLGSALAVIGALESGCDMHDMSRVIQGLVTGIGFLGAGTILKLTTERDILGLTTAASIWVTAGIGITAALGAIWPALLGTAWGWITLTWLYRLEHALRGDHPRENHQ